MTTKEDIFAAVAEGYEITVEELMQHGRIQPMAEARQMAMYLLKHRLRMRKAEIARLMSRTHTTVAYAIEQMHTLTEIDRDIRERYGRILRLLDTKS